MVGTRDCSLCPTILHRLLKNSCGDPNDQRAACPLVAFFFGEAIKLLLNLASLSQHQGTTAFTWLEYPL
jgi:hypothetical protein